jgi:hypothetical protein
MTEDYLHYVWKHGLFSDQQLQTKEGLPVSIKSRGIHNHNSGPDFLEARLFIDGAEWAGHVEIHVRSSDWHRHNHQSDPAYNNVILHVVFEYDQPAIRQSGTAVHTLELKNRLDELGYWKFEQFVGNTRLLACENLMAAVDDLHKLDMLDKMGVERLEQRSVFVKKHLLATGNDWSEATYRLLLYAFGLQVNADAMLTLAERVPLRLLRKHSGSVEQIEAMLLGTAGLLSQGDAYSDSLCREYEFLRYKYNLHPMAIGHFRFGRLRPAGFPTIRLAQVAAIINRHTELFRQFVQAKSFGEVKELLSIAPAPYWNDHYLPGKKSRVSCKTPSDALMSSVVINVMVPILFCYAKEVQEENLKNKALEWLSAIKAEDNKYVRHFRTAGMPIQNAFHSQAILQLYKSFCKPRKCLSCAIGIKLIKS